MLHSFVDGVSDGSYPSGSLIQSGSTLYGMASGGGDIGLGIVFQIGTDGAGFSLLHSFTGDPSDGGIPYGSLVQSGATLYGMTTAGGSTADGTVFSLVVPEPSTFALGMMGCALFLWRLKRSGC